MRDDHTIHAFHDRYTAEQIGLIADFFRDPHGRQPWPVVPAALLIKIWSDRAKQGFIRNTKGLDNIADRMIANTVRLQTNTELCGHTQRDPADVIDDVYDDVEWTEELGDLFGNHCLDDYGQWRISDYAMDKLMDDAIELFAEQNANKKMVIIDRMLNRVHCRGDIASYYVEGGSRTLGHLFDMKEETNVLLRIR